MFQKQTKPTSANSALVLAELIYVSAVRDLRKTHRHAVIGLFLNILQTLILVVAFYVMFELLGLRGMALRGDFLLYLMSGIFMFITHVKTISAVTGADGSVSPMMQHAPMNTIISISASALAALYIQVLSLCIVLLVYDAAFVPISIYKPIDAMGMLLLSWFWGIAVGLVLRALAPWAPNFVGILKQLYTRVNMLASGKMFVVNSLPASKLGLFDWNPLFHIIDQTRGYTFLHYNPHFTSVIYPVQVCIVFIMIGLMGEFYTRQHVSRSWSAGR